MDVKQFLSEFRHIASASKGIQQLREMILSLAVTGDLVKSHLNEPDIISLERIGGELFHYRNRLDNNSSLKEQKEPILVFVDSFPSHWPLVRLNQIGVFIRGVSYAKSVAAYEPRSDYIGLLRANNIGSEVNFDNLVYIPCNLVKDEQFLLAGDILIAMSSGSKDLVGKASRILTNIDRTFGTFCGVLRCMPSCDNRFIHMLLQSPQYRVQISKQGRGIGINNLMKRHIEEFSFCFPPLEEQRSIVAKVDELMALCDKLEAQQQERETLCKITQKTAMDDLATAQSSNALAVAWNRVHDNLNLWLNDKEAITELRNTVCFLGCRGFLTESNPIYNTELNGDNTHLPNGWSWKTLEQLSEYITSGSRGWKRFIADRGDVFIRSQDIKHDSLVFEDKAFVVLPEQVEGMRTLVRSGDLLMTITGANVGKCAQVPQLEQKAYVSQHVALIRVRDVRHTAFLHWWIANSFGGRQHLAQYIYGDKPGLNLTQVRSILIPLPPQEVQDRIMEALEHYKTLFDRLTTQVREAQNTAELLASK